MEKRYTMLEAAKEVGVDKSTLYRWETKGLITKPKRCARTNARMYTEAEVEAIKQFKNKLVDAPESNGPRSEAPSVPLAQA